MKSLKEKQLYVKWAKAMNQPVDPALIEEVEKYERIQKQVVESVKENSIKDLLEASVVAEKLVEKVQIDFPKPPTLEELLSVIKEEHDELVQSQTEQEPEITAPAAAKTIIEKTAEHITKEVKIEEKADSFQQPDPRLVEKNFDAITKKLKFLEQAIGKIAATGAGSGSYWLYDLGDTNYNLVKNPNDGDVLAYNAANAKWEPSVVAGGGGNVQLQSDWNQTNTANVTYIRNKPNVVTDVTSVDGTVTVTMPGNGIHDLSIATTLNQIQRVYAYVTNDDVETIHKGDPVFLYRATGNRPSVILAKNTGDAYSAKTLGLASEDINPGNPGWVQTQGVLTGVNTAAYNEGDTLYLGNVAGTLTSVKPYAPNHLVYIGVVVRANQGQGQIYIRPQNGYELDELHDVNIGHNYARANGQVLIYNTDNNLWENRYLNVIQNNGYSLAVALDGKVSITGNIFNTGTNPATLWSNDSVTNYWRSPTGGGPGQPLNSYIRVNSNGFIVNLDQGVLGFGSSVNWLFDFNGNITFPDSTVQTTAYSTSSVYANVIQLNYITNSALAGYATNTQLTSYATVSNVALKANITDLNTSNVVEGSNQYFTNARTYANVIQIGYATNSNVALKANIADLTTANVTERTNLYFTNARATAAVINTSLSNITVTGNVVAGNVRVDNGSITANAATAFVAGTAAESGVALQMPREGAIRNMTNGQNTMYFDISNGGSAHGSFRFRSSNAFTELMDLSIDGPKSIAAFKGKTSYNVALDTVVTVDNIKYRISNQSGVFPQIASASGSATDVCYDVLGVVSGAGTTNAQNSGYILLADGTWLSIYSAHGLDTRGDRLTAHIADKAAGKIYRATFMVTNNASNTTGYNIIVERIL